MPIKRLLIVIGIFRIFNNRIQVSYLVIRLEQLNCANNAAHTTLVLTFN